MEEWALASLSPKASWPVQFLTRAPLSFILGSGILLAYFLVAISARYWAPYGYATVMTGPPFAGPSEEHLFGTDQLGRDVFSRVVHGTGGVLFLSLASTLLSTMAGGLVGLASGAVGGRLDLIFMRLLDAMISIPLLMLALLIITAIGPDRSGSTLVLIGVVVIVFAPRTARVARAVAVDLVGRDFVTIARTCGEFVLKNRLGMVNAECNWNITRRVRGACRICAGVRRVAWIPRLRRDSADA